MSVSVANPMADLYRRLRAVGLSKVYVRKTILPDWWNDDAATNPAAFAEGLVFLSRHLGLDLRTLQDRSQAVAFRDFGACKFKKSKGVTDDDLALARAMGTRLAQLANLATTTPYHLLPRSAGMIRGEILGLCEPWVNLSNLMDYCWSLGVPVVHMSPFSGTKRPDRMKCPDGMTAIVDGRPVIVLCKEHRFSAWPLFILAHEMGHVALGHIENDGALIDESMNDNPRDDEEDAANAFAVELLTGNARMQFTTTGRWPNARELAESAMEIGSRERIDPGHVVLNYAHSMDGKFFPVANAALALIEPERDALRLARRKMAENLDWSALPEDSSEFLMRMSQAVKPSDLSLR